MPRRINTVVFSAALWTAWLGLCLGTLDVSASVYDEYKSSPITVRDRTGNNRDVPIILRDINSQAIVYSPINYQEGELELPLSNDQLRLFFEYPKEEWGQVLDALRLSDYKRAADLLRPMGYPLVKYLVLPENRFNGHEVVFKLYSALIDSGQLEEALELADKLPLEILNEQFISRTLDLARAQVEADSIIQAIRTIRLIPISDNNPQFLPLFLEFANLLRSKNQFDAALVIYDRMRTLQDATIRRTATLWTAYINVLTENYASAESFLNVIGEIDQTDPDYSLRQLILGRVQLSKDDYMSAINTISQGVVKSDVSYPWTPDLLYSSGLCYEAMKDHPTIKNSEQIAANIYYQLSLFFPKNEWTDKARERMKSLPQSAEVKAALPDEVLDQQKRQSSDGASEITNDDEWKTIE